LTRNTLIFSLIATSIGFACGADQTPPDAPKPQPNAPTTTSASTSTSDTSAGPFDAGTGVGGLSPEPIRRVVMSHVGALRACYELSAASNPDLRGEVKAAWDIDPQGNVHNARVIQSTIPEPKVGECVVRQIASWHFFTANGPSIITQFPFQFGMGQRDGGAQ
jgi:outer membrane biosynthesis protein TonB